MGRGQSLSPSRRPSDGEIRPGGVGLIGIKRVDDPRSKSGGGGGGHEGLPG